MKKLNFYNRDKDDDKLLIGLLKKATIQEPSEQFVDNTIKKFLALSAKDKRVHQPLKFPLFIMFSLGIFLVTPFIFMSFPGISFASPLPEFNGVIKSVSTQLNMWHMLSTLSLISALLILVQIEISISKFPKAVN